jgi:hypothetical protein
VFAPIIRRDFGQFFICQVEPCLDWRQRIAARKSGEGIAALQRRFAPIRHPKMNIPPSMLSEFRGYAVEMADATCNVLGFSSAPTPNAAGYAVTSTAAVLNTIPIPCHVFRPRDFGIERPEGGEQAAVVRFKCRLPFYLSPYFESEYELKAQDQIQIIGGPIYEILGLDDGRTDAIQQIVDVKLVN